MKILTVFFSFLVVGICFDEPSSAQTVNWECSPDSNTLLLWHFDEPSGNTVYDSGPNGNNASALSTLIVPGKFGNARHFDGLSYINCANNSTFIPGDQLSCEAWVNLSDASSDQKILGRGVWTGSPNFSGYVMGVLNNRLDVEVVDANNVYSQIYGGSVPSNQWVHLAFTWQRAGRYIAYINGAKISDIPASQYPIGDSNTDFIMGRAPWGYGVQAVVGSIDEVRVSNKVRSPEEFDLHLAPKDLSAAIAGNEVNLAWQDDGGVVPLMRYKIYGGPDVFNVSMLDSTHGTSSLATAPSTGPYYFAISAVDSTGFESVESEPVGIRSDSLQVLAAFESPGSIFPLADAGWGASALISVGQINDSSLGSTGAMDINLAFTTNDWPAVRFIPLLSANGWEYMTYWIYLPASENMPDSMDIRVFAQDNINWEWHQVDNYALDIPKDVWHPLSFPLAETMAADPLFDLVDGLLGNAGLEILNAKDSTVAWSGHVYVDNVEFRSQLPVTLPVELTSFIASATNLTTVLAWKTATEVNNSGFDIQRRLINTQQWTKVGSVAGAGTSNVPHNYSFKDNVGTAGTYSVPPETDRP